MSHTSTTISKPVTPTDIATVLGVGTKKVGYLASNQHGKINKWSRKKPVIYSTRSELTDAQLRTTRYGFTIPFLVSSAIGSNMTWKYNPPTGGTYAPYRMLDFNGYVHNATPSIEVDIPDKTYLNKTDSSSFVIIAFDEYATGYKEGNLKMTELFSYGNEVSWYPGLLIKHPTKGIIWKTTNKKLSEWFPPVDMTIPVRNTWEDGEYVDVYAILSQYPFTGEPTETPPIEVNSMYYLEYEPGAGHKRVLLETFNFILQYISVTELNINYQRNSLGGDTYYEIYYMTGIVKNTYGGNLTFTMYIEIDNEDTGEVYEYGSKVQLVQGLSSASFMVDPEKNLELPAYTDVWDISIRGVQAAGDAGEIFRRKFNFETGKWV